MPLPITARCNFSCTFCDKQWSREEAVDVDRVLLDAPTSEMGDLRAVLGGGEPTLHPQLPAILEGLRSERVHHIALRSNGAWASRKGPVHFLKKKGLSEVALLLPSDRPAEFDALVRKTGAFDAAMAGVANLREAGLAISVRVPLILPTLPRLPEILQAIPTLVPGVRCIDLCHLDIDDPALQVRYDDLNEVLPFGSEHPWPDVPELFLDPGPGVALCRAAEMAHWRLSFDRETARRHHPPGCGDCDLERTCPGVLRGVAEVYGADGLEPVRDPGERAGSVGRGRSAPMADGRIHRAAAPADLEGLLLRAAAGVGLESDDVDAIQAEHTVLETTLRAPDGTAVRGLRVRFGGEAHDHVGGVAVTEQLDLPSCRTTAFLRHLRAAALGLSVSGAHGQLEFAQGTEAAGIYAQYVRALQPARSAGVDHLTPHTSVAWPLVEAAVDQLNAELAPQDQRVGLLRRTPTDAFEALRMSSVLSAVAAALEGLARVGPPTTPRLSYAIWGYGRAGQAFARRMDSLRDSMGRRSLLVGLADSSGAKVLASGLEQARATAFKRRTGRIPAGQGHTGDPTAVLRADADLLLLSGRGPSLDATTAARLKARVVVDLTGSVPPQVERVLASRGVVFVPSPISTAGPTVLAELERQGELDSVQSAQMAVGEATRGLLARTLDLVEQAGLTPTEALVGLGLSELARRSRLQRSTPPAGTDCRRRDWSGSGDR